MPTNDILAKEINEIVDKYLANKGIKIRCYILTLLVTNELLHFYESQNKNYELTSKYLETIIKDIKYTFNKVSKIKGD